MNRRIIAIGTGASALLMLTGCVADVPEPVTEAPALEQEAALLEAQSDRIVEATMAELALADEEADADLLTDRIGGDAVTVRKAQYTLASADDGPTPVVLPAEMQAVYSVGADTWPRTLASVSQPADEDSTPVVMLWIQDDVDTDYQLRGWAHMIPGATIPAMAGTTSGAEQLTVDADGLLATPEEAISNYLELLREGEDSEFAEQFTADSYREQLFASREALTETANDAEGEYVDTIESDIDSTYVMGTADGGALVFAPVSVKSSFSVDDGIVEIAGAQQPLVDGDIEDVAVYEYRDLIVLHIPAADSDDTAGVVAADHNLIRITDS
ncbi:hypothetical protein ON058_10795 [Demequina sp. B12]|uniref:hypothetical protein n=1 Tax=Demequina sp. B12 TaxID=2992757 RepID=UPI00237B250C|nr:hypothetical protein [Demequina sp. B12]MDE0573898.1 hypothetical protein [Demequina sp. B12]